MSDVPVTAAWTLALVLTRSRRPLTAGLAMAVALAFVPAVGGCAARVDLLSEAREHGVSDAASAARRMALGVAESVIGIAVFNRGRRVGPNHRGLRPGRSPLGIALTRGAHALCDAPQIWPPAVRMKQARRPVPHATIAVL